MKFKISSFIALLLMAALFACSPIKEDQSGVTITGNTASIHGQVVLASGTALARKGHAVSGIYDSIMVYLLQEVEGGYEVDSMTVDSLMAFRFEDLEAGVYTLQARLPNGELLTEAGIRLTEGQSRQVDLRQGGSGMGTDSMVVWELDIACGDTTLQAVFYGPGDQAGGIQIRMLEQPMAYYGRSMPWQEGRGTKIALRFPRRLLEGKKDLEILTGVADWGHWGYVGVEVTGESKTLFPEIDTIPNRRMRISWNEEGPTCTMIDSIGIPHVSCKAYEPPRLATLAEIQSGIGLIFRDMVNELGVNDSVAGYLFLDEVMRGRGGGLVSLWESKQYMDSVSSIPDGSGFVLLLSNLDKAFLDSIPLEVIEGLYADTLLPSIKIGGQLNHSDYWNQVPGIFYDELVTYYTTHHVPFDSSLSRYQAFLQFPNFVQSAQPLYLNRYEDYALVSQGNACDGETHTLLRRNASGVYKLIKRWSPAQILACD